MIQDENALNQETPFSLRRGHTIVCVDDEHRVLLALQRLLRNEPYLVMATDDPSKVLEWVKRFDVSLVLADQRMPAMPGTELSSAVRRCSPQTIVLIVTGFASAEPVDESVRIGDVRKIIDKPWNDFTLKRMIRALLIEREERQEGRRKRETEHDAI